ncbi:MAG: hypothetical protein IMW89_05000 [Ktedonobacteraceae bacterium]|nr:hypothetical protein [Ktedonobacteraceae bacterium]
MLPIIIIVAILLLILALLILFRFILEIRSTENMPLSAEDEREVPPAPASGRLSVNHAGAIDEQAGAGWLEARDAIERLEKEMNSEQAPATGHRLVLEPIVLYYLVRTGHSEIAMAYYRESSSVGAQEAETAITHLKQEVDEGRYVLPEPVRKEPEPAVIRFLLRNGQKLIALRYYRDCTDAGMTAALRVVEHLEHSID